MSTKSMFLSRFVANEFLQRITKRSLRGTCQHLHATHFQCHCPSDYLGIHCEHRPDHCFNVSCQNKGLCRSLSMNSECQCVYGTWGEHCEHLTTSILVRQYVIKGILYIVILAISFVIGFVVLLDILNPCSTKWVIFDPH